MRTLIAENNFTSRNILTAVLRKHGHEVIETRNGLEAWEAMQQPDAPLLVILDWMMPGLDGVEVCRRVRTLRFRWLNHLNFGLTPTLASQAKSRSS